MKKRKNAKCDGTGCLVCERPDCTAGAYHTSMKLRGYHAMVDGKRGESMPEIALNKGRKVGNRHEIEKS